MQARRVGDRDDEVWVEPTYSSGAGSKPLYTTSRQTANLKKISGTSGGDIPYGDSD
jgi:hypothetical protein